MKWYAEYKDSGIEWIGKIPKDYTLKKLKHFTKVKDGTHDTPEYVDETPLSVPLITSKDITNGELSFDDAKYISKCDYEIINARSDVERYNVIMPMIGTVGNPAIVLTERIFSIKNVALFKTSDLLSAKFLQYFLNSWIVKQQFDLINRGGVQQFVSLDILKNIFIVMPKGINGVVSYLDHKTTAIDTLVADKQKLIELLKEKRQAIISEAVTKGLDKNAKMKDSGIEWIGEIPEGWETKKFGYLFSFGRGLNITKADLLDDGVPCVSYGEIHSKYGFEVNPDIHVLRYADMNYLQISPSSLLSRGNFVFADTSEDIEGSGNFTCLNSNTAVFAGYHSIIARQKGNHNYRYLSYLFDSIGFRSQIRCKVSGIKVFSITQTILKDTVVVLPPIQEQATIAEYLDNKTAQIGLLVSDIQTQIEKLKEYRQSIISEAVTGKAAI